MTTLNADEEMETMRTLFGVIALISLAACATQSPPLKQQKISFDDGARSIQRDNPSKAVIEYYARLASVGNADGMVPGYDSAVREALGDIKLRDFLAQAVTPFFSDLQAIAVEDTVVPTRFPAGRDGEIHYTYVVTHGNTFKPVVFALVNDAGNYRVASVALNACMVEQQMDQSGRCK